MSRRTSPSPSSLRARPASRGMMERLEGRTLLAAAARATSIITDNRGEVTVTFDQALDPTTVKSTTVQMYTAGADNTFGTSDDVRVFGRVRLKLANRRIWFRPYN